MTTSQESRLRDIRSKLDFEATAIGGRIKDEEERNHAARKSMQISDVIAADDGFQAYKIIAKWKELSLQEFIKS